MHGEYLESSSVHGCAYVHGRNSKIDRIIWLLIIAAGFLTASLMIKAAFQEWDENPVLITLDTIAAPINEIQFPTITVCQDPYKQPDNWGYIETVLNTVQFSCPRESATTYQILGESCQAKIGKIRNDFKYLIRAIIKNFQGLIYSGKLDVEVRDIGWLAKKTVDAIKNKTISMNDVNNWPYLTFANGYPTVEQILKDLGMNMESRS